MKRSDTSNKNSKRQKRSNEIDINTIINNILHKKMTISEAASKYDISQAILTEKIARIARHKQNIEKTYNPKPVFTKEQEIILRDHILKCCKYQSNVTNITIRRMAYDYAIKLSDCEYPMSWGANNMANIDWFRSFKSRHPILKKALTKKYPHSCICIMGCHMGSEGKEALKKLEAKVLISRVYHYLQREFEYIKMCNDLGVLANVLRRTAEATGVCEQTICNILEEETTLELKQIIPDVQKENGDTNGRTRLDQSKTVANSKDVGTLIIPSTPSTETADEDSRNSAQYSDLERLQQNATLIKSVEVEILDEDLDKEDGDQRHVEAKLFKVNTDKESLCTREELEKKAVSVIEDSIEEEHKEPSSEKRTTPFSFVFEGDDLKRPLSIDESQPLVLNCQSETDANSEDVGTAIVNEASSDVEDPPLIIDESHLERKTETDAVPYIGYKDKKKLIEDPNSMQSLEENAQIETSEIERKRKLAARKANKRFREKFKFQKATPNLAR